MGASMKKPSSFIAVIERSAFLHFRAATGTGREIQAKTIPAAATTAVAFPRATGFPRDNELRKTTVVVFPFRALCR